MGGAALETANVRRVDPDGSVTVAASDMLFPNGSVITDAGTLIVNETFGNRRVWAQFAPTPTSTPTPTERELDKMLPQAVIGPDGNGLDAEGALWIANALGNRVVRVREGGEIIDEIKTENGVFAQACWAAQTASPCSCARPPISTKKHARPRAKAACWRSTWMCRTPACPEPAQHRISRRGSTRPAGNW